MANVADSEIEKLSKTELILSLLAEQGPKTEYELYKQLPKVSHGTIHYCLDKLAQGGAITYVQSKHKKNQTKKQYYLSFMGTLMYVASFLYWLAKNLTEIQIEERWKQFDEEKQVEMAEFLERQGKLLNYALFEESNWLFNHYPGTARVFAILAQDICNHPPQPFKNLFLAVLYGKVHSNLLYRKKFGGKLENDPALLKRLQVAYRREFTRLFFETFVFTKLHGKATVNVKLQRLAQEAIEEERHGLAGLELAVQFFGGQAKQE